MEIAQDGDIIVLAGKGHEDYQEIKGVKYHMDERELVADIIAEGINKNKIINIKEKSLKPNEFWLFLSLNYLMNLLTKFHLPITGSSLYLP